MDQAFKVKNQLFGTIKMMQENLYHLKPLFPNLVLPYPPLAIARL
ncbi:MAG: hypothetical protein QNJ47_00795 [Nostocaceae cyanobacterium]|nr:hypothetical protein [Nostocaceae cyanobacterium]